jgi:hypothetical protein
MRPTCENIGLRQRQQRMKWGIASFALSAVIIIGLVASDAARGWRLLALPSVWLGVLCLIEAKSGTCVVLAARGVRNMGAGNEPLADAAERKMVARQSRRIHLWALLVTLLLACAALSWL